MGTKKKKKEDLTEILYVAWEESERGWGTRPDGCSLHLTRSDAIAFEQAYWARMPDQVPDEYSRPFSSPSVAYVSPVLYRKIEKKENGLRLWEGEESRAVTERDLLYRLQER